MYCCQTTICVILIVHSVQFSDQCTQFISYTERTVLILYKY